MYVALTQQDVLGAVKFDFGAIFGFEEDLVAGLDRSNIGTHRDDARPRQSFAHGGCRRNHDPASTTTITGYAIEFDEHSIVQKFDRDTAVGARRGVGRTHAGNPRRLRRRDQSRVHDP